MAADLVDVRLRPRSPDRVGRHGCRVTTATGEAVQADAVVLAVPAGPARDLASPASAKSGSVVAPPAARLGGQVRGRLRRAVLAGHRAERAFRERGRARLDLAAAGGRAVGAGAARAVRRVRRRPTRRPGPGRRSSRSRAMYGARPLTRSRPGPACGARTRGRRATSRTGGPATSRRSGRCTAPTSRRSTCAAPTSGWPATWKAPSAPGGRPHAQH